MEEIWMRCGFPSTSSTPPCAVGHGYVVCPASASCRSSRNNWEKVANCPWQVPTPSTRKNGYFWMVYIQKINWINTAGRFKQTLAKNHFGISESITFLGYFPKLNKERMLRLHQKQPLWFSMKMWAAHDIFRCLLLRIASGTVGAMLRRSSSSLAMSRYSTTWQSQSARENHLLRWGNLLKWWYEYPTAMGFPTKSDHFGAFWGYDHFHFGPKIRDFSTFAWLTSCICHFCQPKTQTKKKLGQQPNTSPQTR